MACVLLNICTKPLTCNLAHHGLRDVVTQVANQMLFSYQQLRTDDVRKDQSRWVGSGGHLQRPPRLLLLESFRYQGPRE